MAFRFTDDHLRSYHEMGFVVFRGIIPPSLLGDLRKQAAVAREIARKSNVDAQRLQPLVRYADRIDLKPFKDYTHLPELVAALDRVLPFEHWHGITEGKDSGTGILIEPGARPWATMWHRDWRDNAPGLPLSEWESNLPNLRLFNQVNCALYEDTCTWVVPGSHMRRDLEGEHMRFPTRPIPGPTVPADCSDEEAERICLEYSRSLPGAMQVHLDAGDFMLYRNSLWHLGNYVPYKRRATIHDFMNTPEFAAWMARNGPVMADRRQKGMDWEMSEPLSELSHAPVVAMAGR